MTLDTFDELLLRLIYDGQLKKMLAYIAAAITTFVPQFGILFFVVGKAMTAAAVAALVSLEILLWFGDFVLVIAIVTKFQELVILERRLGIIEFYSAIRRQRFVYARLWDKTSTTLLGVKQGALDYKSMNRFLVFATSIVLITITGLSIWVVLTILASLK